MMNVKLSTQNVAKECWKAGQSYGCVWHAMSLCRDANRFVQAIGSGFEQISRHRRSGEARKE